MLDCGFPKATALIWPPGGHDTELNGCSVPQSSELMRWMSVMSDAGSHSLHNGNPFHYAVDGATWNSSPEKLSPSLPNELHLPTPTTTPATTKSSNGINNGTSVGEESLQVSAGTNSQLYSNAPTFTRPSMVTGNSMANTSTANNSSMGQILSLTQPFKFSNHLQMSNGATRKYQCKMCPQVFHSKADMQMHTQVHMREAKPYKCSQCSKSFANSSYLSQHTRIHLGIKPYRCEICQRKFTQLSHLQQHIRTHTGDKPYKCRYPNCIKAFSQLSNLQSHSRSHQTDKPFKCNSCYKCFTDEAGLLEHIPKHKESKHLKTHICQFCGKSYTQETYLAKHMQKHSDRLEKRAAFNRMPVHMPDNYWAKNSVVTCQSSSIECSTNLINAQQQPQQQQQAPATAPQQPGGGGGGDGDGGHQCLQSTLGSSPNGHLSATARFDHHSSRLPTMAAMNARHSDELIYGIDSNKSGNSAFTALPSGGVLSSGANVRMPYFSYEPFNFPNKATSSGMESKKTMEVSPKAGQTSFPNQLIALNQIRNYASMPAPVSITSGEHPISLKEE